MFDIAIEEHCILEIHNVENICIIQRKFYTDYTPMIRDILNLMLCNLRENESKPFDTKVLK